MIFSRGGFRLAFCAANLLFGIALAPALADAAAVEPAEISARRITEFHIGRPETRFGPLEFVGGLEMTSRSRDFGALSAFRFLKAGSDFFGVADTGFWFSARWLGPPTVGLRAS